MAGRSYLAFADIGKLTTLRVECTRCPRAGRYSVAKLIALHGREANMANWNAPAPDYAGGRPGRCLHPKRSCS